MTVPSGVLFRRRELRHRDNIDVRKTASACWQSAVYRHSVPAEMLTDIVVSRVKVTRQPGSTSCLRIDALKPGTNDVRDEITAGLSCITKKRRVGTAYK